MEKKHRSRRIMDSIEHAMPGTWGLLEKVRAGRDSDDLPSVYVTADEVTDALMDRYRQHDPMTGAAVSMIGAWRMTQCIYRFDETLRLAILDTPMTGNIPSEHLYRLPAWSIYIETPWIIGVAGIWAGMGHAVNLGEYLSLVLDLGGDPRSAFTHAGLRVFDIPLRGTIDASIEAFLTVHAGSNIAKDAIRVRDPLRLMLEMILPLALYLCADPDLVSQPGRHSSTRIRGVPADPVVWSVGTRIGAAIRQGLATNGASVPSGSGGQSTRPHVRRAHWHTILSGPRRAEDGATIDPTKRKRDLRWMPPIPVNVTDLDAMPSVIRQVRKP